MNDATHQGTYLLLFVLFFVEIAVFFFDGVGFAVSFFAAFTPLAPLAAGFLAELVTRVAELAGTLEVGATVRRHHGSALGFTAVPATLADGMALLPTGLALFSTNLVLLSIGLARFSTSLVLLSTGLALFSTDWGERIPAA